MVRVILYNKTKEEGALGFTRSTLKGIVVLREVEAGVNVSDICCKYGMSDATYYDRKVKHAGLTVSV